MKFSVCIDAVFRGNDLYPSLKAMRELGIDAFEFWGWWDKDIDTLLSMKNRLGLTVSAFCTRMVSLVDASQRAAYLKGLRETLAVAEKLSCRSIITQVGADTGCDRRIQHESLAEGLRAAAPLLEESGVTLLVEPLNILVDHKGYYLSASREGFDVIAEVASPGVKLLFDIYHQQITEGNLIRNVTADIDKIGHFHAAGNPGRHELDRGEIRYPEVFRAIDEAGYRGYMGLEYFPLEAPLKGLKSLVKE